MVSKNVNVVIIEQKEWIESRGNDETHTFELESLIEC